MALTLTADLPVPAGGLRPLDAPRDLGAVSRLIGQAFAGDLDRNARAALRDMRWMARLSPFVWWWAQADPDFRAAFNGFVWEEPSPKTGRLQIVGNASLNRTQGSRSRWIVCNIAVRPEYRRQGIARRLTESAVAEAADLGAESVLLQVLQENVAARRLYAELGFREVASEADLRMAYARPGTAEPSPGLAVRPWRRSDGPAALELARRAVPQPLQWLQPVRVSDYAPDRWLEAQRWLADRAAGRRSYRWTAWAGERLAGLLTLQASTRSAAHQMRILAEPAGSEGVEAALAGQALRTLEGFPMCPLHALVRGDRSAALLELGFEPRRALITLEKELA